MGQTGEQGHQSPPTGTEDKDDFSAQSVTQMASRKLHEGIGIEESSGQDTCLRVSEFKFLENGKKKRRKA